MNLLTLVAFSLVLAVVGTSADDVDLQKLQCLVCRAAIKEVGEEMAKVDKKRNIDVGNYRLDAQGNEIRKLVPMSQSAVHISEVLDGICEKFSDYVRATYKSNGKLTIFNLMLPSGGMNPKMSEVDIIQDGDLNKSLTFLCSQVVNEYDEEIVELVQANAGNIVEKVCSNICDDDTPDDDDDEEVAVLPKVEL